MRKGNGIPLEIDLRPIDLTAYRGGAFLAELRRNKHKNVDGICVAISKRLESGTSVLCGRGRAYEYDKYSVVSDSFLSDELKGYGLSKVTFMIRALVAIEQHGTDPENIIYPAGLALPEYEKLHQIYWMRPSTKAEINNMPSLLQRINEKSETERGSPGLYCLGDDGLNKLLDELQFLLRTGCVKGENGIGMKLPVFPMFCIRISGLLRNFGFNVDPFEPLSTYGHSILNTQ